MAYQLTFANIPFVLDVPDDQILLSSLLPTRYLADQLPPPAFAGKNVYGLAVPQWQPAPEPALGEWYYPTGARRWSAFHGLATTEAKNAMLAAACGYGGASPQPFVMQCDDAANPGGQFSISTEMYLLPPRPLQVTKTSGGGVSGLWMVTLVDERYYWQGRTAGALHITTGTTTWQNLISSLTTALGAVLPAPTIPSAYLGPEADSQLWTNYESAALLLDVIGWNIGQTLIRNFNGVYEFQNTAANVTQVLSNRGPVASLRRLAGGGLLDDAGTGSVPLPAAQAVLPSKVIVTFPKYNNTPAGSGSGGGTNIQQPHFVDSRTSTRWIRESYSDVYAITIPISQAAFPISAYQGNPDVKVIRTTAKALLNNDGDSTPTNQSTLQALALQIATDFWSGQIAACLDEVYPGTVAWTPEGIHDILWTYRSEQQSTRVFRQAWNYGVSEMQHGVLCHLPQPEMVVVQTTCGGGSGSGGGGLTVTQENWTFIDGLRVSVSS